MEIVKTEPPSIYNHARSTGFLSSGYSQKTKNRKTISLSSSPSNGGVFLSNSKHLAPQTPQGA